MFNAAFDRCPNNGVYMKFSHSGFPIEWYGTTATARPKRSRKVKKTIQQEVVEGLLIQPRTWRSYWIQAVLSLVLAAWILGFLAVVANDVPWTLMVVVVVVSLAFQALLVAWRMRKASW